MCRNLGEPELAGLPGMEAIAKHRNYSIEFKRQVAALLLDIRQRMSPTKSIKTLPLWSLNRYSP